MRYMLLIYTEETADQAPTPAEGEQMMEAYNEFGKWLGEEVRARRPLVGQPRDEARLEVGIVDRLS